MSRTDGFAADGVDELTGRGIYYGVNASEASQCEGDDVYVIGAANSAGQAALNLSRFAKRVVLVARAATLGGHHVSVSGGPDHGGTERRGPLHARCGRGRW